jgi:hypothetical protein
LNCVNQVTIISKILNKFNSIINNYFLYIGLEYNNRILVVTYLLKYYIKNATKHPGWLITISKALPTLYTYKLGLYFRFFELFLVIIYSIYLNFFILKIYRILCKKIIL